MLNGLRSKLFLRLKLLVLQSQYDTAQFTLFRKPKVFDRAGQHSFDTTAESDWGVACPLGNIVAAAFG
jgi:hypothetical protein